MRGDETVNTIGYIVYKDIRTYYCKPPILGWGLLFPATFILAITLKHPGNPLTFLPGLIGMVALFGATTMEVIVIAFEKRLNSFERLLLAPISISSLVIAKILSGVLFSLTVSLIALLGMIFFLKLPVNCIVTLIFALFFSSLCFSSLGAFIALMVKEVYEAQIIINFLRFPMLFLCGVFFPISSLPRFLQPLSYLLPLTYAVDLLKISTTNMNFMFNVTIDLVVLIFFTIVLILGSIHSSIKGIK
ncbi:MAG: ABC transporter permease [bacterium]